MLTPTRCRSTGLAWVAAFGQIGGWLAPQTFVVLDSPLTVFALLLAALPVLILFAVPETKGKKLL